MLDTDRLALLAWVPSRRPERRSGSPDAWPLEARSLRFSITLLALRELRLDFSLPFSDASLQCSLQTQLRLSELAVMSDPETLDEIRNIMADVFDLDLDQGSVTPETTANDIEEWDSLSHIRLIVAIERKFGVRFTNAEIESLKRVGDLIALIEAKAAA